MTQSPSVLTTEAAAERAEPAQDDVWRVCRVIRTDCRRCPPRSVVHGDNCIRACYLHAVECINTVETGNPWRKTEGVKAPWTVKAALSHQEALTRRVGELEAALRSAIRVADEARDEGDAAPSHMRAGKLLIALSGNCRGYRADIDAIHAALNPPTTTSSGETNGR